MKTPLLNALMHIRLNGPSLDDAAAMEELVRLAFETWNCLPKSGQRCPQRSSRKPRPGREKAVKSLRVILAEMEYAPAVPQPAPMAVEEAERLRQQQQMEAIGPFPVHHPDWTVDGQPVFTPVAQLPNLDDPTEVKGQWIAIKWAGINRWHVGKVVVYYAERGDARIIYAKQYCKEADDAYHYRGCVQRLRWQHFLRELQHGAGADWVLLTVNQQ